MTLPSYQFGIRLGDDFQGTPSVSSIITSFKMEKFRAFCDVPTNINLKMMEESDEFTLGGEHNAVLFTQEHLVVGLWFPVPAIVKHFFTFHHGTTGPYPS